MLQNFYQNMLSLSLEFNNVSLSRVGLSLLLSPLIVFSQYRVNAVEIMPNYIYICACRIDEAITI